MYFIGDEEISALKNLFDNKKKLYRYDSTNTTECDLFEKEYSEYIGSPFSLLLSSGTNSLLAALLASGIQPGDEVIIPSYTFVATAAAVIQAGAVPVIANIDPELSLDFKHAENLISPRTKAVILVSMDGLVANVQVAQSFCRKHNLILIEDVAQALGASLDGKKLGTFGEFGCFSLNENKNISCGEGGILITQNKTFFEKAFCLHDGPAQFNPNKKKFFTEITPFLGFSMRVSEIQGAIMRVQLKRLDFILSELRKRKNIYKETLGGIKTICGYSEQGECGSSLHFLMESEELAFKFGSAARSEKLMIIPVTARPAHVVWQWSGLLGTRSHIQDKRNPYSSPLSEYNYSTSNYLQSVDILMKVLKMDIDIHLSLEETQSQAKKLRMLFERI